MCSHVPFILIGLSNSETETALLNPLICDEVTDKNKLAPFYGPRCSSQQNVFL